MGGVGGEVVEMGRMGGGCVGMWSGVVWCLQIQRSEEGLYPVRPFLTANKKQNQGLRRPVLGGSLDGIFVIYI